MLGLPCEEWKRSQHMLTAPPRGYAIITAAADGSSSSSHSANSFSKDGRKISVGDCALFKPPQDCPPFIGIIRFFSVDNDSKLNLVVNWLYRPAEVKLGKGVLLEATPNEIFYSFHKDEIPAASLLHPCKVAFLPKGVELPSGTSSFVCRRVYDITNKCLWWLTDQDYINEHQEEVNHLLHKTQVEMHAAAQPGGRSPKPMNSTSSASPLKTGSDNVQNSTTCISSQVKGKKRERVDHSSEQGKRERTIKTDDMDSGPRRQGSILKIEMEKITDKGGLIDSEGVEKLLQLMVPDKSEKLDLAGQAILAGVIAATDKHDCLSQFVQLKGLLVFDEWIQDVHRGKFGDLSGPKDSDKSVEEFLLVLLRALDKLPVNLQALQMCNIGKSVNRLRSHKNLEIQKKARGLVDTWKKRVEAEMNINDAKSGFDQGVSWSVRPRLLDVSQGGNKQSGGSSEVAIKSSISQVSSSKLVSSKTYQGESVSKQASTAPASASSPGSSNLLPPPASADSNAKERQLHSVSLAGASDLLTATERDEKVSGSSQSHSTSQSFSGEQTKSVGLPAKDDVRSSTSASMTVNKMSGSSSRQRKLNNGVSSMNSSGVLREIGTTRKSSIKKNTVSDKLSQSGVVAQKAPEGIAVEGSSNKLIVKIPNHVRNPAQDATGGSPGDPPLINSRASSAAFAERPKPSDHSLPENTDFKSVRTGSDGVDRSHAFVSDDSKMIVAVKRDAPSPFVNENSTLNLQDASFTSMNSLIESCVKYSEADATLSAVDDAGMNLLASVAAGEFSESCLVPPIRSPQSNGTIVEESDVGGNSEVKYPNEGGDHHPPEDSDDNKHSKSNEVCCDLGTANRDANFAALVSEEKSDGEKDKNCNKPGHELPQTKENTLDREEMVDEKPPDASFPVLPGGTKDEVISTGDAKNPCETNVVGKIEEGDIDGKPIIGCSTLNVEMDPTLNTNVKVDVEENKCSFDRLTSDSQTEVTPTELQFHSAQGGDKQVSYESCHGIGKTRDNIELKAEKSVHFNTKTSVTKAECQKPKAENMGISTSIGVLGSGASETAGQDAEDIGDNLANKEADGQQDGQKLHSNSPANQSKESEKVVDWKESKLIAMEVEDAEECSSTTADASSRSATGMSDGAKVEFDLNEGLNADEGKCLDIHSTSMPGSSNVTQFVSPVPFSASGVSNNVSTSVTVTAAAKGPFVPPEDLLKNKVELGWKGSAATSAFRPAEPRKVVEMSLYPSSMPVSDVRAGKQSRPLLDIDLNIADERMLEDVAPQSYARKDDFVLLSENVHGPEEDKVLSPAPGRCTERVNLDLNQTDETPELANCLTNSSHRIDEPVVHSEPLSCRLGSSGMNVHRDFDLNNGPGIDETNIDSLVNNQQARISVQSQQPIPGFRMRNSELGNLSTWFPSTGNTYSAMSSSIMSDRGEQPFPVGAAFVPQRVSGPSSSGSLFGADVYRGPILSSSPAVPFSSRGFQYPVFHVGSSFPVPSTSLTGASANFVDPSSGGRLSFPAANPQLLGTAPTVPSYYPRPYVVCIPDSSNGNSPESSRKWTRQGLDLNAGPGGADGEGRNDSVPLALRHHSVGSSQSLAEENARMIQMSGSILKRKEPEGGWDGFKQSSWQ